MTDINPDSVIIVEKGSISISTNNNSSSNNVTLNGAKVIVDGVDYNISDYTTDQVIKVEVHGDVKTVKGNIHGNTKTMSGDITSIEK